MRCAVLAILLLTLNGAAAADDRPLLLRDVGLSPRPLLRGLNAWTRSAITSLPVPLSPVIKTVTSLGPMRSIVRTTSRMAGL